MKKLYFLRYYINTKVNLKRTLQLSFGIGLRRANKICSVIGLHPTKYNKNILKVRKFKYYQFILRKLSYFTENTYKLDDALKKEYAGNIRMLKNIKCYRGFRHAFGLPTRGQRSHSNASTVRKLKTQFIKYNDRYRG
jgi:small subunit ribosomal protein S13